MADAKEQARIEALLDNVSDSISDIEKALKPVLEQGVEAFAAKLPALERAKFYTLIAYSLNSLTFMCQKLQGLDPRQLPVYTELQRVKQYFGKIKAAESADEPAARPTTVNKDAASRFIKHGLSGNEKFDAQRARDQQQRKVNAHIKFDQITGEATSQLEKPDPAGSENVVSKSEQVPTSPESSSTGPKKKKHKNRHHKSSTAPKTPREAMQQLLNKTNGNKT